MPSKTYYKRPDAELDYGADYGTSWLAAGDALLSSIWIVPDGITKVSDDFDNQNTVIVVTGGTKPRVYELINEVESVNGNKGGWTIIVKIT